MSKILAIGELLIDFTPYKSEQETNMFQQNAGGAPANVAVQAAILGASTAFIGKVGNDQFGHFLKSTLEKYNVSTTGLIVDNKNNTTLAFVHLSETGDRSFSFYRNDTADTQLNFDEIDLKLIDECDLLHFGSISLTTEPIKTSTLRAVKYAKEKGKIISYDPNYRNLLWESQSVAKSEMKSVLAYVDIIKVSEEELKLLTDCDQLIQGIAKLLNQGIKIVVVTQGAKGCIIATKSGIERLPTYDVKTIDTTGSGDSFWGSFLYNIVTSDKEISDLSFEELKTFCDFSNACGSLCSTKKGAIPAMPTKDEIEECMLNIAKLK